MFKGSTPMGISVRPPLLRLPIMRRSASAVYTPAKPRPHPPDNAVQAIGCASTRTFSCTIAIELASNVTSCTGSFSSPAARGNAHSTRLFDSTFGHGRRSGPHAGSRARAGRSQAAINQSLTQPTRATAALHGFPCSAYARALSRGARPIAHGIVKSALGLILCQLCTPTQAHGLGLGAACAPSASCQLPSHSAARGFLPATQLRATGPASQSAAFHAPAQDSVLAARDRPHA
ncbi:hypothetical protein C8Q77DRAFT_911333 [Trametes polyzona]|nr:hypothetical protein C8Q77DRAFT_911333 [Trametes polyzona]